MKKGLIIIGCIGVLLFSLVFGLKKYALFVASNKISDILFSKNGGETKQQFLPKAEKGVATSEEGKDYKIFNENQNWFKKQIELGKVENWEQETTETYNSPDGLSTKKVKHSIKLNAYYLKNENDTKKTVIIAHGFGLSGDQYGAWAKMYYDLGYNVLLPDARAHGKSQGDYISFGLQEKYDYTNENGWINQTIQKVGNDSEIYLHGGSMGAATMMMVSGESLPSNVKLLIEDCGYSDLNIPIRNLNKSILKQLENNGGKFEIKRSLLGLDVNFLIKENDINYVFNQLLHVFNQRYALSKEDSEVFKYVSARKAMSTTKLPVLFIHGQSDTLVPFEQTTSALIESKKNNKNNSNYKIYFPSMANHGASIKVDYQKYKDAIQEFIGENT
ncbi:alpha/beta hydrolase [Bacillus thuringiensis]|uniref:alpha/beta hydrolase n=1 Tax=Bacillus thuringiensis TaxID=1428 RepID=UPI0010AC09C8|nr:alpha/beta fold hydrolase [Bacillus thuringiensis]MBV6681471.1 alpha/beta hydrolase [Bacillus thuringiensis]TKA00684.1 alpha/beta hydrolase [Bacillus thuringiensis]HDX9529619.1 alpha/beta fold hydrolase [Bacillus thuringiensis]